MIDADAVQRLLPMRDCIAALDAALAASVRDPVQSFVGGAKARDGKFHLKAALSGGDRPLFAAKINANYPRNPEHGRPTIQGVLVLFDATTGEPLATMDSGAITAIRTAAATAVAARHLTPEDASSLGIVGCGVQAFHHVEAFHVVRRIGRVTLFDSDMGRADALRRRVSMELGLEAIVCQDLRSCTSDADMVATLTSSRQPFLSSDDLRPGAFVGAVGTDSPDKSEIDPRLMSDALVVVDDAAQCAEMGDLRHAIAAGAMKAGDVWATLAGICADPARYRPTNGRTVVFDSTGIPIEDVVAARIVIERLATD
jgi:alanine dehydrogenase